ncbi:MAG: ABC transporter substrate-binding protein/permease [bacterium]
MALNYTKKLINIFVIFVFCFSPLLAQNQKNEKKPVLKWAADAESGAPYAFQDAMDPLRLIGFEVDIIKAIAEELGMTQEHVQNQWDGLIPGLERNDYQVAINGLEITKDRERVVAFSEPYYITYEQLVVRKGEEKDITNLSDLIGKPVGTLKGALAERILRAAGGIDVRTYDSEKNSYNDLELERLDAVLIDHPVAMYYAGWNPQLELAGQPIGEVIYGIAMKKSDTLLLKKINGAIQKLKESGKLREILEHWNMWNFMMANYLDDPSASNVPRKDYEKFINQQKLQLTFWDYFNRYVGFLPIMGQAALLTVGLSIVSMIVAIILGLLIALLRVYAPRPFSSLAVLFIEVIRGTPLLIQLFFIYYALPVMGIKISAFFAAIIGLGCNYAAYEAENYRAGIFAVPKGQMEAAISLGMRKIQALRFIILPQAIRVVIPPITNDFISLLKDSSLVSVIAMVELTKVYTQLSGVYYDYIGTGIMVAVLYLLIGLPFVKLAKLAERKYSPELKTKFQNGSNKSHFTGVSFKRLKSFLK